MEYMETKAIDNIVTGHEVLFTVLGIILFLFGVLLLRYVQNRGRLSNKKELMESFEMSDLIIDAYELRAFREKYKKDTDKYAYLVKDCVLKFMSKYTGAKLVDAERYDMAMQLIAQVFLKTRFIWTQEQKTNIDKDVLEVLVLSNMRKNNTSGDNKNNVTLNKK